jgi:hypothetical protein
VLVGFSQRARIEVWARDFIHRQTGLNQDGDQAEGEGGSISPKLGQKALT